MWVLQPHDRHLLTQVFLAEYTIVVNHQNFWKGLTSLFSEENGRNMVCQDGKKLVCYICGSYDHMLEVSLKSELQTNLYLHCLSVQGEGQRAEREE